MKKKIVAVMMALSLMICGSICNQGIINAAVKENEQQETSCRFAILTDGDVQTMASTYSNGNAKVIGDGVRLRKKFQKQQQF